MQTKMCIFISKYSAVASGLLLLAETQKVRIIRNI